MIRFYFHPTPNTAKVALFPTSTRTCSAGPRPSSRAADRETRPHGQPHERWSLRAMARAPWRQWLRHFLGRKPVHEDAVKDHSALWV